MACPTTCRRRGGIWARRPSWRATFRACRSSSITPALPADRSAEGLAGWREALETVAAQPNVSLKISGHRAARRALERVEKNAPIVRDAIRIFGADRCMFASNFPVDGLTGSFDTIFSGFKAIVGGFAAGSAARAVPRQCGADLPARDLIWTEAPKCHRRHGEPVTFPIGALAHGRLAVTWRGPHDHHEFLRKLRTVFHHPAPAMAPMVKTTWSGSPGTTREALPGAVSSDAGTR